MQTAREIGKYVTDGKMVYPYNAFLDDDIKAGRLTYCERPAGVQASPKPVYRNPINFTPEERLEFAQKLGITLGELTNMSPQEFEAGLLEIEQGKDARKEPAKAADSGFPE